ncbi:YbjN domain-containing protein [Blastochloris tepida]|uniref:YbjN domain-containing protein n=1 Tax=Blastochloris tepida TaxID=2233851 RepID=A0A348FWL7_9HYPH|nr:YbjN domain-containing protein [Blastochloris tepida]BBF91700.1 hypothetical protein BLTE_03850 [Blastochloris tepida]
MSLIEIDVEHRSNPVDLVERLASANDWTFERSGDDEITLSLDGRWSDYHVSFSWMDQVEALHMACAFDLKVPEGRRPEVLKLLAMVNEQMWLGHFDLWSSEGVVMFRHAQLLAGGASMGHSQCEALLQAAVDAVERFYPAFQFVVWAGKSAREALDASLLDTVGEA